jgi:hypothetical protein
MVKNRSFAAASLLGFTILLSAAVPTLAGTLSIRVSSTLWVEENILKGHIDVSNDGDEAAYHLEPEIRLPGKVLTLSKVARLEANQGKVFSLEEKLVNIKAGSHPLPIRVTFHDAHLYPFTALSCPTFAVKKENKSGISCQVKPLTMGKKGRVSFFLENLESRSKEVRASLFLPMELFSPVQGLDLPLGPSEKKRVDFKLVNAHAFPGATYPVFGIFQYDDGGDHYTLVRPATVTLVEGQNWFYRTRWYWLFGAGGLAFLMSAYGWVRGRSS